MQAIIKDYTAEKIIKDQFELEGDLPATSERIYFTSHNIAYVGIVREVCHVLKDISENETSHSVVIYVKIKEIKD